MNPIALVYGFKPSMLKFCLMHVLHLGLLLFLNGASLTLLVEKEWFGPQENPKDFLEVVTLRFRRWCSVQGIRLGMGLNCF